MIKYVFKILLLGSGAVGKTSLLNRFVNNQFSTNYELTLGVDFLGKDLEFAPNETAKLTIWDIAGQKRFNFLHSSFYQGANGALLIFDLTRKDTFTELQEWLSEMRKLVGNLPFILIGNKVDLIENVGTVISLQEIHSFAESEGSIYIVTSAKSGLNVEQAFIELTRRMVSKRINSEKLPTNPFETQGLLIKSFYYQYGKEALPIIRNIYERQGRAIGLEYKKKLPKVNLETVIKGFLDFYHSKVKIIKLSDQKFQIYIKKCPFNLEHTSSGLCDAVMVINYGYFNTIIGNNIEIKVNKTLANGDSYCDFIYELIKKTN